MNVQQIAARFPGWISVFVAIAAAFHLAGWSGPSGDDVRRWPAAAVLVAGALLRLLNWKPGAKGWELGTFALAGVVLKSDLQTAMIAFALGTFLLFPFWRTGAAALLAMAIWNLLSEIFPEIHGLGDGISRALVHLSGVPDLKAGPTPLAVLPWVASLLIIGGDVAKTRTVRRALIGAGVVTVVEIVHCMFFHVLDPNGATTPLFAALPWTCAAFAAVVAACTGSEEGEAQVSRRPLAIAAAGGFLLALGISIPLLAPPQQPGRIVALNEGGLDWERPKEGKWGVYDYGMFGLLPYYLKGDGFSFEPLQVAQVEERDLAEADILLLINAPKMWKDSERAAVRKFMERGKSVLVLGDHTDVFGLQRGYETLLAEYGIHFLFDSAYHARAGWTGCAEATRHPVSRWSRPDPFMLAHSIGASLECGPGTMRLVQSRYSFSDIGIRENVMGSFLGNYRYTPGERLGDLTLIASRTVGAGKLIVYGDTSAFQNGGMSETYARHVLPLFRWLSREATWVERPAGRWTLVLFGVALLVVGIARGRRWEIVVFGAALVVTLAGSQWIGSLRVPGPAITADTVLIDKSHLPWVGHYDARMNPDGPLHASFIRAGFRVLEAVSLDARELATAKAVAFVAPTREFSGSEVARLLEYQDRGGIVILSVGGEQMRESLPLLHALGLEIAMAPMGTIPKPEESGLDDMVPRFMDAWPILDWAPDRGLKPISREDPDRKILFQYGDDVVSLFQKRGRGGTLVIADSRYFSSENIQGMWGHWPGNVRFIHNILKDFFGAKADEVQDLFRSPEKPR